MSEAYHLRPFVSGGVGFSSNDDWDASAAFEGAPAGTPNFTVHSLKRDVTWRVTAGFELYSVDNVILRAQYDAHITDHYSDQGWLAKLGMRF